MTRCAALALCLASMGAAAPRAGTYVNPLSIPGTRSVADPAVLRFHDRYYLFLTGGMVWVSADLVHWEHHPVTVPGPARRIVAPNVFQYRDFVYLTGNDTGLYRARTPEGPWEYLGDIRDANGRAMLLFDSMGFVDDDGRVYMYYSGRHADGIWGVELDRADLTRFAGPPVRLWTYNPDHVWERYGDSNEGAALSWIEAPWMTKHNGTYYLQYSAPGTEWKTYAVGVYTSRRPLGRFTYAPRNPVLVHRNGLINGTGHHCVVAGPDGNLWAVYTVLYRNWNVFDRRIGLDPVGFDEHGNMFVRGPSEAPGRAPGAVARPWLGNDAGSIPVSINRYTFAASSARPGRDATYAFDNNVRTWWSPAGEDRQPWLLLDLGCRNARDPNQEFTVDSARILFDHAPPERGRASIDGHTGFYPQVRTPGPVAYRYRLEVSNNNRDFVTVVDKTGNTAANNVEFDRFTPVRCRYARLTITAPPDAPLAVLEFTVFGR